MRSHLKHMIRTGLVGVFIWDWRAAGPKNFDWGDKEVEKRLSVWNKGEKKGGRGEEEERPRSLMQYYLTFPSPIHISVVLFCLTFPLTI